MSRLPTIQDVDALYIQFKKTTVTTKQVAEGIAIYDAERRLAGIEILDAVRSVGDPAVFTQVVLEGHCVAKAVASLGSLVTGADQEKG